jgi:hypothetical protein
MRRLLDRCCSEYDHARVLEVDYSPGVSERLGAEFFDGRPIPRKAFLGGPFYSYFFGLDAVSHNYVLHADADMMYGGGSQTWIAEAIDLLKERPDVVFCSPLPGPPTDTAELRSQTLEREPHTSLAFRAHEVSTRIFFMDMERFRSRMAGLTVTRPPFVAWLRAVVDGHPARLDFETIYSRAMVARGLLRVDFLGSEPGMWSVHPPYRSARFYERLPGLIEEIESGRIPEAARGHHDVHDSMVDWSDARRLIDPLWRRALKHQRLLVRNVTGRLRSA